MTRIAAIACSLVLVLAACGGGGEEDSTSDTSAPPTTEAPEPTEAPQAPTTAESTTTTIAATTTTTSAPTTTTSTPPTTAAGQDTDVFQLEVGDCINVAISDFQETLPIVDCDEPHDSEIYATFLLADGPFPGEEAADTLASDGCLARFEPTFGEAYEVSPWFISYLVPTLDSWNEIDDREVLCLASGDDLLVGSIVPAPDPAALAEAAEAMAQVLASPTDGEPSPFTLEVARCAANIIVPGLGAARLISLGITADNIAEVDDVDFEPVEIVLISEALAECADLRALVVDSLVDDGSVTPAEGECLAEALDEEVIKRVFQAVMGLTEIQADATAEFLNDLAESAEMCGIAL